jgi:hypothetical protein
MKRGAVSKSTQLQPCSSWATAKQSVYLPSFSSLPSVNHNSAEVLYNSLGSGAVLVRREKFEAHITPVALVGLSWEAYNLKRHMGSLQRAQYATIKPCIVQERQKVQDRGHKKQNVTATSLRHLFRFEDPSLANPADPCGPSS